MLKELDRAIQVLTPEEKKIQTTKKKYVSSLLNINYFHEYPLLTFFLTSYLQQLFQDRYRHLNK